MNIDYIQCPKCRNINNIHKIVTINDGGSIICEICKNIFHVCSSYTISCKISECTICNSRYKRRSI